MNDTRPEWYERMKRGPMRERTFTEEKMGEIVRQAEGDAAGGKDRFIRWYMVIGGAMVVALMVMILSQSNPLRWLGPELAGPGPSPMPTIESFMPSEAPTESSVPQSNIGYVKGEAGAFTSPEYMPMTGPAFVAIPGIQYDVIEQSGEFVKIAANGREGWVYKWYLTADRDERSVISVDPYTMLIKTPVTFGMYPDEAELSGYELEAGKAARVTKEYEEWVSIEIITYDQSYVGDRWVRKTALEPWNSSKAKEGRLRPGGIVRSEHGEVNPLEGYSHIFIREQLEDGRYGIGAPGGFTGYIRAEDFMPNPFLPAPWETWSFISQDEEDRYREYAKNRDEEQLRALVPLEVFKYYVKASEAEDFETVYGLFMKDDGYELPSYESYLGDLSKDEEGRNRSKQQWAAWREHDQLYEEINGDQAVIHMTHREEEKDTRGFQLVKNRDGIWKVAWMPMQ
ncbi:hypothetical protein [Paenibacillus paeoniae]|uniref:SH3 domain-containing protein n=1 Tax=Paenibacillus paeoniae TaxID=2292705 RepID=A0A371P791_9BACL|nr:hypothetical protein [Paenibacillus paeoniae]REK71811.1 hypothetical protein DX130_19020 [Paenibacillus paeoniae]